MWIVAMELTPLLSLKKRIRLRTNIAAASTQNV